jgi:hypothetical protein
MNSTKRPKGPQSSAKGVVKTRRRRAQGTTDHTPADHETKSAGQGDTPQTAILRRTHVHRSQAHTSSLGRRRQARRDTK